MRRYVKTNRNEVNKWKDSGHLSLTNQILIRNLPKTDIEKYKQNWKDFKYRVIKEKISKGDGEKLFVQPSLQVDKIIKEKPLEFLAPRPTDIKVKRKKTKEKVNKVMEKSKSRERSRELSWGMSKKQLEMKKMRSGSAISLVAYQEKQKDQFDPLQIEADRMLIRELGEEDRDKVPQLNVLAGEKGGKLKKKVKTIVNAVRFGKALKDRKDESDRFSKSNTSRGGTQGIHQAKLFMNEDNRSPSSKLSGSRFGLDAFSMLKPKLNPSHSFGLSFGSQGGDKSSQDDGAKPRPSPSKMRPLHNEVGKKKGSLKSVSINDVDSETIRNSSNHSSGKNDTQILILRTENEGVNEIKNKKENNHHNLRIRESQRFIKQSSLSRRRVGLIHSKSVKQMMEDPNYKQVGLFYQVPERFLSIFGVHIEILDFRRV